MARWLRRGSKEWRAAEHAGHDLMIIRERVSESTTWSTSFGKSYKKANASVIKDRLWHHEKLKKKQFSFDGGRRSLSSNHFYTSWTCHKNKPQHEFSFHGTRPKIISSPLKVETKVNSWDHQKWISDCNEYEKCWNRVIMRLAAPSDRQQIMEHFPQISLQN